MAEPTQGVRGTKYSVGTEGSLVRDVSKKIYMLQPNETPLLVFMTKAGKKKVVATNPKVEWFEDQFVPNTISFTAGGTGTSLTAASGTGVRVKADDILVMPNGESVLVSSVASDTLTVVRSMGAVAAYTIVSGTQAVIAGNAVLEGADNPEYVFTKKEAKLNYIQIFRDSVKITATQDASESYGGADREYQRMKKGAEHKRFIEQAMLLGDGFEDTSGTQARRGLTGVLNFIVTNIVDAGGVLTEAGFEAFLRPVFRYHPQLGLNEKLLIASPIMVSAINFWAKQLLRIETSEKTFGVDIARYRTGHGVLGIANHWLLEDFVQGGSDTSAPFKSYSFALDTENIIYRYLEGLDTKLHLNIGNKFSETYLDEYRTHCSLQLIQEKTHGYIKNVTGFAA